MASKTWSAEEDTQPRARIAGSWQLGVPNEARPGSSECDVLEAFDLLARRGAGGLAWAAPFRHDPIAFLLDSMSDAANLWDAGGELLYQNRAAEHSGLGRCDDTAAQAFTAHGKHFERRCLRFSALGEEYLLELIRELPWQVRGANHAA